MHYVFPSTLLLALNIVDRGGVVCHECLPSGRRVFRVAGTGSRTYGCLPDANYCTCPAYMFSGAR